MTETTTSATAATSSNAQPALWVERIGTRRYVGRSANGATVQIGSAGVEGTFTPGELLKIALAGCSGLSSDISLARRLGDDYDAIIHVSSVKDEAEDRYTSLIERLEVDLSALDPEARDRLITVVTRAIDQTCTVGRTLNASATVDLSIDSTEPTAPR